MVAAFPKGREPDRFAFNDLRSKSASDTTELAEASARLGHTTTGGDQASLHPQARESKAVEVAHEDAGRFPRFALIFPGYLELASNLTY